MRLLPRERNFRREQKMTDDKGAGKLAEELFREWWLNNSEAGLTHSGIGFHAFTSGFNAGRKAEREWYAGMVLNAVYASYMEYSEKHGMDENWRDGIARDAFKMADAMLRAGKGEK